MDGHALQHTIVLCRAWERSLWAIGIMSASMAMTGLKYAFVVWSNTYREFFGGLSCGLGGKTTDEMITHTEEKDALRPFLAGEQA